MEEWVRKRRGVDGKWIGGGERGVRRADGWGGVGRELSRDVIIRRKSYMVCTVVAYIHLANGNYVLEWWCGGKGGR